MKNKKIIFIFVLLIIIIPITILFLYQTFIKNYLVFITSPDGTKKIEWIQPIQEVPYHYTNVYVEGENVDFKYKAIFTLDNNKVINCRYITEYFDTKKALESFENKKINTFLTDLKIEENIITFNDNATYDITLEHLLETLKSANVVTIF